MKRFFYPRSICVVGASSKVKSIGYEILKSIKNYDFKGRIYPVNPKVDEILGFRCFNLISEIDDKVDLAIIVVPKKYVNDSIDQLAEKGVKEVILITAGFGETGEEGKKSEEVILEKLKTYNMKMVGPNCMGIINTLDEVKLNATFVAEQPEKGGTGFLSQSGALGAAVLNSLRETNIKFAHFISIGNKTDISELDVLKFWISDENIKTIAFYLESIEYGLELIKYYKKMKSPKPLIVLKAGKTAAGMKAASSHTGAISSNEKIIDSLFDQFGIIRVSTINEMFNTAKGFEFFPALSGNKIAIVTNAGGPAILAVDKLEERKLVLAEISNSTKVLLKEIVHPEGSLNNPVDLLPGGTPEIYKQVNEILIKDKNVDGVISIFVEPVMINAFEVIESVNSIESNKPIYQVCLPVPEFWQDYKERSEFGKPVFRNPEEPAELISNILHYEKKKNYEYNFNVTKKLKSSVKQTSDFIDQDDVLQLCKSYRIPVVDQHLFLPEEVKKIKYLDFPIVIKGISRNVSHKSELDAVKLNIIDFDELKKAAHDIERSFNKENITLEKFLIQPFLKVKHELLVGALRDDSFGPVIMFGSGGKYVEVIEDTKLKSAYLNKNDIEEMINNTKIGKIIRGIRGEHGINLNDLYKIIKSVADLMLQEEEITEIDLNPLVVNDTLNLTAVDVRIKVKNI